ncbi:class I SAM-dependent methyltransferase [Alicyclobacillus sp. SP_1]|uniref:class I SAM-dependent methyltransferase n=1 Tax=Alicyclobacillus sp. SP_1 TaxID=2942475 RepID=UPI002157AD10|nr:class I SAM-dependent methyltransferase [Alicyclobacillus sp. SP_1]
MSDIRRSREDKQSAPIVSVLPIRQEGNADKERCARQTAAFFGATYLERRGRSVEELFAKTSANVVVLAGDEPSLIHRQAPEMALRYHPGMSLLRLREHQRGRQDRLLRAIGVRPGDVVLDATCGLLGDALLLAAGVGQSGRVIAVESTFLVARLMQYAVRWTRSIPPDVAEHLAGIEMLWGDSGRILSKLGDASVDAVYFDPMFHHPLERSAAMEPLRIFANHQVLTRDVFADACRVARRTVVIKCRLGDKLLSDLPVLPDKTNASFAFAVWQRGRP